MPREIRAGEPRDACTVGGQRGQTVRQANLDFRSAERANAEISVASAAAGRCAVGNHRAAM